MSSPSGLYAGQGGDMKRVFKPEDLNLDHYRVGPLAPYIHHLAGRLSKQQYGYETARHKVRVVADLSHWLERRRLKASQLDEQIIGRFLYRRRRYDPARRGDSSAATLMLELLRELDVAPSPPPARPSPRHSIERSFERYLREERRLSQASLDNALPYVRRLLVHRFGDGPIALDALQPSDVIGFVLSSVHTMSPSRAKLLVGALRSFFRFLLSRGEIAKDFTGAVPSVADWRLSSVPKGIDPKDVRRLLKSCDRRTPTGRRDYAVLLLLARLGLRGGEVAALTLDDIDWDAGELTIRGKGPRSDRLPLPKDVGKAIVAYLRRGRPTCATRRLFVSARAPIRPFKQTAVGCIVRRAIARAGVDAPRKGAHVLRHALAIQMLRRGASLPEIGELLRHRRLDTTAIYTKVDLQALRALAQAWPGGAA
jgi:site-specific recombinase XerD